MFDDLYSQITSKANYKLLAVLPILLALIAVLVVLVNGLQLGIEFRGGTWIEVVPDVKLSEEQLQSLSSDLESVGLTDVSVYSGKDIVSGTQKITIVTTSVVDESKLKPILSRYAGVLYEVDTATIELGSPLSNDVKEKLASRFNADIFFNESSGVLRISAFNLDEEKLRSAMLFYLGRNVSMEVKTKNLNVRPVGETLGKTFRSQGMTALALAYVLVVLVVFLAFRDPVPSLAVILSGTCDALVALGGMSLFRIPLEPSSLVSLLMIVGYSVDTDILLTSRVLKVRGGSVDDKINDSMKTGLTMMATTISVMVVMLFISTVVVKIDVLASISSVLLMGLVADIPNTWLTNAGILKWYVEEKGGKFSLRSLLGGK